VCLLLWLISPLHCSPDATIGFRLKAELLESKNRQIFTGVVEGLKVIKKPGDGRRVPRQPQVRRAPPPRKSPRIGLMRGPGVCRGSLLAIDDSDFDSAQ
jgi:hypothetical protein